jgi:hypothetical protein
MVGVTIVRRRETSPPFARRLCGYLDGIVEEAVKPTVPGQLDWDQGRRHCSARPAEEPIHCAAQW